ncbi:MAG: arsenate reductase [Roseivirga sp.]|jgi:arsenate reductase
MSPYFYPDLSNYIEQLEIERISEEREQVLQPLIDYIGSKRNENLPIQLNFICTHNSRRSQWSQIWAKAISEYFGIATDCFSGGVETTAFNENAVNALKEAGFQVKQKGQENPVYSITYADASGTIEMFSKQFDDKTNPRSDFAAIMTCSHADENCPVIPGAAIRIPIRYDDPKAFDGTPLMAAKYLERCKEIATEMYFVFSQIEKQRSTRR